MTSWSPRARLSGPARFIFATEGGTIAAWAPNVDLTHAITVVPASGAIYKGLALGGDGTRFLIYATDFHNGKIDVFDKTFSPVSLAGGFADSIPDTFAPFGIQNLGGSIYVTYAKQDKDREDDVPGRGEGHRQRLHRRREVRPAHRQGRPAQCALGSGHRARRLRRLQQYAADRQLRGRHDQRLRSQQGPVRRPAQHV
jgi:uncharacterized protein (TIGR03118 family)